VLFFVLRKLLKSILSYVLQVLFEIVLTRWIHLLPTCRPTNWNMLQLHFRYFWSPLKSHYYVVSPEYMKPVSLLVSTILFVQISTVSPFVSLYFVIRELSVKCWSMKLWMWTVSIGVATIERWQRAHPSPRQRPRFLEMELPAWNLQSWWYR